MTLNKKPFASTLSLAAIALTAACSGSTEARADAQTDTAEIATPIVYQTAEFTIENMSCASCPITVRKAIERVPGVQSVEIDYPSKIATVEYDPALATPADIAAEPTGSGYPATLIES